MNVGGDTKALQVEIGEASCLRNLKPCYSELRIG